MSRDIVPVETSRNGFHPPHQDTSRNGFHPPNRDTYLLVQSSDLATLLKEAASSANSKSPLRQSDDSHFWGLCLGFALLAILGLAFGAYGITSKPQTQIIEKPIVIKETERVNTNCLFFCK